MQAFLLSTNTDKNNCIRPLRKNLRIKTGRFNRKFSALEIKDKQCMSEKFNHDFTGFFKINIKKSGDSGGYNTVNKFLPKGP